MPDAAEGPRPSPEPVPAVAPDDPILIWGGGAIGGTLAAYWAREGIPVHMVDVQAEHVRVSAETGLKVHGPVAEFLQCVPGSTPEGVRGAYCASSWRSRPRRPKPPLWRWRRTCVMTGSCCRHRMA